MSLLIRSPFESVDLWHLFANCLRNPPGLFTAWLTLAIAPTGADTKFAILSSLDNCSAIHLFWTCVCLQIHKGVLCPHWQFYSYIIQTMTCVSHKILRGGMFSTPPKTRQWLDKVRVGQRQSRDYSQARCAMPAERPPSLPTRPSTTSSSDSVLFQSLVGPSVVPSILFFRVLE